MFCCLAYLPQDPGNDRAQLWLTCLSPKTYYLHHLLALSQNLGCASEGMGARDATKGRVRIVLRLRNTSRKPESPLPLCPQVQLLQCPSKHQVRPPGRGTNSSVASMFLKGEAGAEGRQSLGVERQAEAKKPHNHRQISTSVSLSFPACHVWVTTCPSHLLCWAGQVPLQE